MAAQALDRSEDVLVIASPSRPRNWWRLYNWRHRIASGHWPVWGATYGGCGSYLTECEHCGKWC